MSSERKSSILICDDQDNVHLAVKHALRSKYEFRSAHNGDEALAILKSHAFDLLLLDLAMRSENEGLEYLPKIRALDPELPVCIFSGRTDFETVRRCLHEGVLDFIPKDFAPEEIDRAVQSALSRSRLDRQNRQQRKEIVRSQRKSHPMLGRSPTIEKLRKTIEKVKKSSANILILGETGTGKEVVARQIRESADGSMAPFIAIDSSTIQSSTAESILFGHEKGAFTGADKAAKGLFEEADGGIIYFDEIGNMPLEIQAKLLRVMQEKEVLRLGSSKVLSVDFRVIGATNKDLQAMAAQGLFKDDLLQRLNVLPILVPPLRERPEDIPLLLEHFLNIHSDHGRLGPNRAADAAIARLTGYSWPGNIRELSNVAAFLVTMAEGEIIAEHDLPTRIPDLPSQNVKQEIKPSHDSPIGFPVTGTYHEKIAAFERSLLEDAYQAADGSVTKAAQMLGLDRSHLHHKLKELGIHSGNRK